jgi:hypothetical protein
MALDTVKDSDIRMPSASGLGQFAQVEARERVSSFDHLTRNSLGWCAVFGAFFASYLMLGVGRLLTRSPARPLTARHVATVGRSDASSSRP